jgi:hypothetical protein
MDMSAKSNSCSTCGQPTKHKYCCLKCQNTGRKLANGRRYLETNPKRCIHCSAIIPYDLRHLIDFCQGDCLAEYRLAKRLAKQRDKKAAGKAYESLMREAKRFEAGLVIGRETLRKHLLRTRGSNCTICNRPNEWQGKPLTLIVDHIDGNASDNSPSNLRLLCPNCDSQTPTFGGRNLGKGRKSRGLKRGR